MYRKLWKSQSCCEFTLQWFHTLLLHFKVPVYFWKGCLDPSETPDVTVGKCFATNSLPVKLCKAAELLNSHKFILKAWIICYNSEYLKASCHHFSMLLLNFLPSVKNIYKGRYNLPANVNIFFLYNQIPIGPWNSYILCMFCMWSRDGPPTSFQPCLWALLRTVNSTSLSLEYIPSLTPRVCSRCGRPWLPSSSSPCVSSWPGSPTAACSSTSTWASATVPTSATASWWRPRETWRPTREAWRWSSTASSRRGEVPSSPLRTLVAAWTRTAPWRTTSGQQPGPWRWEPGATCPTPTAPWWTWRAAGS